MPTQDRGYLIAEFPAFGGARIPLLTDEECRARGIEPGRLPPRETWTQEQRDAADRLMEIFTPHVIREAMLLILSELEKLGPNEATDDVAMEKLGATRALAVIDAGRWKQQDTWCHFPASWVREVVDMFATGRVSVLGPADDSPVPKPKRSRQRRPSPAP
jgi:hypothetical protein